MLLAPLRDLLGTEPLGAAELLACVAVSTLPGLLLHGLGRSDTPPRADGPVVVGVDGSEPSDLAIGFAVEEADRRGTELVAVHAWLNPAPLGPGDVLPLVYDLDALAAEEERVLAEAVAGWSERYPQVPIRQRLVRGAPARMLVEESTAAQLVVVGARGRGGLTGMLLGSVSQALLHHACCPVTVVRHHDARN